MNTLVPKMKAKVVSDINTPMSCPSISNVHSTTSTHSTNYLDEGFGILFLPASLNDAALTCLEWIGLS
jgi:hypothetical protein